MLRRLVLPFYVPNFVWAVAGSVFLPVLPMYARALGADVTQVGLIVALYSVGAMVATVPAAEFVSRVGTRRVMIISLALETAAAVVAAVAPNAWVLGGAMAVLGGGNSAFLLARLTYFRTEIARANRARALTFLAGQYRIGSAVGPLIGGLLAGSTGFRPVFVVTSLLIGVSTVLSLLFVPRETEDAVRAQVNTTSRITNVAAPSLWRTAVEHRRVFATAGFALLLLKVMRESRRVIFPLFGDALGLDPAQIGMAFSIASVIESLLFIPVGFVMDRFGRKYTAVPCMVILASSFAMIPVVGGMVGYTILLATSGLGNGLGTGIDMTFSTDFAPRNNAARFLSVWRLVGDSGGVVGPAIVGAVAAAAGFGPAALVVAALGVAAATITVTIVPEPRHHAEHA